MFKDPYFVVCREKANTQPLATRAVAMLIITEKKPQCMFCEGTIWHGPSFKNLAMPNDPEKTEMENVVQNMIFRGIPIFLIRAHYVLSYHLI